MSKLAVIFFLIYYSTNCIGKVQEGYCWRDFEGTIPKDAISAGKDSEGRTLYIGQVLHEDKLIPGMIYSDDDRIHFEWSYQKRVSKQNVKILCVNDANNFEWIPMKANKSSFVMGKILLKGGYEPNYLTYIGRVREGDNVNVGKVICRETTCISMYAVKNGTGVMYDSFETLGFDNNVMNEYSWGDYEGKVPWDALTAGTNFDGKVVYIGQTLFEDKLIPGTLHSNDSKIYFEWNGKGKTTTQNIKIFVTLHPYKFEWIPVSIDKIKDLRNKILIKGGYESNYMTFIGKVRKDGVVSVGKVLCNEAKCLSLYINNNGIVATYERFEILSFNV